MPTAKAGPEGGVDVASGGSVTLEVEGPESSDLWGTNVSYAWAPPAGITVTYTDGTTANSLRPAFIVPATGENVTHAFRLTATGRGGVSRHLERQRPGGGGAEGGERGVRGDTEAGVRGADGLRTETSSSRLRSASTGRSP